MTTRALAVLLTAALSVAARAQRVELVPEAVVPSAPGASAVSAAPMASLAPALNTAALAAPAIIAAPAIAPASALAAAPVAAASAAPASAAPALVPAGQRVVAAAPAAVAASVAPAAKSAPGSAAPSDALAAGVDGSIRFDGAREHAGAAPSAPVSEERAPSSFTPAARPLAKSPGDSERMASTTIPAWMREELPVTAAKLGRALPSGYEADVLARSKVWVYKWHSPFTYEVPGGLPDGHYDPKFGIRVMLKMSWRRLKDPESHFRVLFAHEYTHWLQNEGLVTRRYGGEIPAVAVELLRARELVGEEGMKAGRIGFIAESHLQSFEDGRAWARGDMKDVASLYHRGVLGGAAYEVGRIAGRPEAAWEFLNLVIAEKGGLSPREAFERVTGLKK